MLVTLSTIVIVSHEVLPSVIQLHGVAEVNPHTLKHCDVECVTVKSAIPMHNVKFCPGRFGK